MNPPGPVVNDSRTDDAPEYGSVEIPAKPPTEYTHHERRAKLLPALFAHGPVSTMGSEARNTGRSLAAHVLCHALMEQQRFHRVSTPLGVHHRTVTLL